MEPKRLTHEGSIIISVRLFGHAGDIEVWADGEKKQVGWYVFAQDLYADAI